MLFKDPIAAESVGTMMRRFVPRKSEERASSLRNVFRLDDFLLATDGKVGLRIPTKECETSLANAGPIIDIDTMKTVPGDNSFYQQSAIKLSSFVMKVMDVQRANTAGRTAVPYDMSQSAINVKCVCANEHRGLDGREYLSMRAPANQGRERFEYQKRCIDAVMRSGVFSQFYFTASDGGEGHMSAMKHRHRSGGGIVFAFGDAGKEVIILPARSCEKCRVTLCKK